MASEYTERDAQEVKEVLEGTEKAFDKSSSAIKAGLNAGTFPANYFSKKDDEKRLRLVQDYSKTLNVSGLPSLYQPTEDDVNVLLRKDQEKELLNFEAFLQNYFDLSNPIHQKLVREIYPNYFERRLEVIRENLNIQEKIAKLKLLGPQTKEDIFFVYALLNGDIQVPNEAVFNLDKGDSTDNQYKRGFFNYKRWAAEGSAPVKGLGEERKKGIFTDGLTGQGQNPILVPKALSAGYQGVFGGRGRSAGLAGQKANSGASWTQFQG